MPSPHQSDSTAPARKSPFDGEPKEERWNSYEKSPSQSPSPEVETSAKPSSKPPVDPKP